MVQRFGRVNRAGLGRATVTVVHEGFAPAPAGRPGTAAGRLARRGTRRSRCCGGSKICPPGTLRHVDREMLSRCSVSRVTFPRLDAAVVESYAMTSADLVRPPRGCTCGGVAEESAVPETWLAWGRDVADLVRGFRMPWRRRCRSSVRFPRSSPGCRCRPRTKLSGRRFAARRGGCPNCIVPPRSTDEMDKVGAVEFATTLLAATCDRPTGVFHNGLWEPVT